MMLAFSRGDEEWTGKTEGDAVVMRELLLGSIHSK